MSCDPRKRAGAQQTKSEFFRTVGKIGDIEALNHIDGRIGQGLRALETISNQLRTGTGVVASIWRDVETSTEAGADAVMTTVGIDPSSAKDVGNRFNPGVLNRAIGQATTIYERVRQGNFEIRDVPEAIQDFGNLTQLLGGIFAPRRNQDRINRPPVDCYPSPWATDLINLAPKHKFMFVVEFQFSSQYVDAFGDLEFAFVVKRAQRPVVNFEYEDINYYNFHTKVLKRSEYAPLQMTFYDDMLSNALKFYNRYLQIISPVSRGNGQRFLLEEGGMTFDQEQGANSASVGPVGNTTQTIIRRINLYHLTHAGRQVDVYQFDTPRLQAIQLDDLDMTDGSTGTEVTIEFNYDRLYLQPGLDINTDNFQNRITNATDAGKYAITFENLPADNQGKFGPEPYTAVFKESTGGSKVTSTQVTPQDTVRQQAYQAQIDAANQAIENVSVDTLAVTPPNISNIRVAD